MDMAIDSVAEQLSTIIVRNDQPERVREIFPWWHALQVAPNREVKAAEFLKRINVHAYLPQYVKHVRTCHGRRRATLRAVVPGMLFAPVEMLNLDRRDEVFRLCHVHDLVRKNGGEPLLLSKADIEVIRRMEADLYVPPPPEPTDLWRGAPGDAVQFKDPTYAAFWGKAQVVDIDQYPRISVAGVQLFGVRKVVWTTADKIEAAREDPETEAM